MTEGEGEGNATGGALLMAAMNGLRWSSGSVAIAGLGTGGGAFMGTYVAHGDGEVLDGSMGGALVGGPVLSNPGGGVGR